MNQTLDMDSQVAEIDLLPANLLYTLGFSIQIRRDNGKQQTTMLLPENSIDEQAFETRLEASHIWNDKHEFYVDTVFLADLAHLRNAGLHIAYDNGQAPEIIRGSFDEIKKKLTAYDKIYNLHDSYVKNGVFFTTASPKD